MRHFDLLGFRNRLLNQSVKFTAIDYNPGGPGGAGDGARDNSLNYFLSSDGTTPYNATPQPPDDVTAIISGVSGNVTCKSWTNQANADQSNGTITLTGQFTGGAVNLTAGTGNLTITATAWDLSNSIISGSSNTHRVILNGYTGQLDTLACTTLGPWVTALGLNISNSGTATDFKGLRVTGNLTTADGVFAQAGGGANEQAIITGAWTSLDTNGANFNNMSIGGATTFVGPMQSNGNAGGNVFTGFVTFTVVAGVLPINALDTYTAGWKAIVYDMGNLNIYPTTNVTIPPANKVLSSLSPNNYGYSDAILHGSASAGTPFVLRRRGTLTRDLI